MKRMLHVAGCLLVLALASCSKEKLVGNGNVVTQTWPLAGNFEELHVNGVFEVIVTQGPVMSLTVEGESNVLSAIEAKVQGSGLYFQYKNRFDRIDHDAVVFRVTVPDLKKFAVNASGHIEVPAGWETDQASLVISGSGTIDFHALDAEVVGLNVIGSGEIKVSGVVPNAGFRVDGSGNIKAFDLNTEISGVIISGSGNVETRPSEHLEVEIFGSGNTYYRGEPVTMNKTIVGSGQVIKVP